MLGSSARQVNQMSIGWGARMLIAVRVESLPLAASPHRGSPPRPAGEFDQAARSTEPTLGPIFGPLYVLKQIADALGITAALSNTALGKLALFWSWRACLIKFSPIGGTLGRGSRRQRSAETVGHPR
jgi:hypothetical protein